ncbi:hypothetical protein JHJ32_07355 [Parapedobacter sp. ISTM3]|uniref:hypothetical protein n=1 Tax=Parapedobacter sp. ISTM3 TaxID=2800130 RepID=UPI001903A496|nr:hypothetical protein [Parapedobacter sp. ISTM3]MBK1439794.1 hypothetical protein [Parapedobacter sp. ISTM3]
MKKNENVEERSVRDDVARAIADKIISMQLLASKALNRWERNLGLHRRKLVFTLFFGLAGGYCAYLLGNAFLGDDRSASYPAIKGDMHRSPEIPFPVDTGTANDTTGNSFKADNK